MDEAKNILDFIAKAPDEDRKAQAAPDGAIIRPVKTAVKDIVSAMKGRVAGFNIFLNALPDGNHVVDLGTYETEDLCAIPVMIRIFGAYLVEYYSCTKDDDGGTLCLVCLTAGEFLPAMPVTAD